MTWAGWDRVVVVPEGMDPLTPAPARYGGFETVYTGTASIPYSTTMTQSAFPSATLYPSPTLYPHS